MKQNLRTPRRAIGLGAIVAAAALVALSGGGAARAGGKLPISQGIGAAVLPSAAFGDTPADTQETVAFVLQANNLGALEAQVSSGMPQGYLTVAQFARQYGQSPANVAALEHYLARYGISSHAMADGLDVQASGTAGEFDAALSVQQQQYRVPPLPGHDGRPGRPGGVAHGTKQAPLLPRDLARSVLAVLGLSNYPTMQSNMIGVPEQAQPNDLPNTHLVPADFANRYDLTPVYAQGGTGHGRTIGIVTLASLDPNVAGQFWKEIGLSGSQASASRVTLDNVDGGSGPVNELSGSGESTLDVEQSGALAPDASIVVYQASNTDAGFADAFFQAASDNTADTLSTSWGESETVIKFFANGGQEDPNYARAFDEAFLELAAQGQSGFDAAGDAGAYDDSDELGSTDLAVDNPAASPWITAGGGTTLPGTITFHSLPGSVTIPAERAWGWDYLWPVIAQAEGVPLGDVAADPANAAGGGGGYSSMEPMPSYQSGVPGTNTFSAVQYLTPIDAVQANGLTLSTGWTFDSNPPTTHGHGNGRAVPDVSTDADPETGYQLLYTFGDSCELDPSDPCQSPPPPSYLQYGGTSFVAPQLNGATAAIDSLLGRRVGFWNPSIYRFATQRNSPFAPLDTPGTSNDNLYYSGTPGTLYNPATGLGTPDFARLAADFAAAGAPRPR